MNRIVATLTVALACVVAIHAQSFIDHVQKTTQGQGSVTVKQSDDITNLVNGKKSSDTAATPKKQDDKTKQQSPQKQDVKTTKQENKQEAAQQPKEQKPAENKEKAENHENKAEDHEAAPEKDKSENKKEESPRQATRKVVGSTVASSDGSSVDTRKKVMRKSYKVTGYRVQAFAGGNTRADRQKAEQIGNTIKSHFPDQPVYVHFYSPRWICRVGNFKTQEDAQKLLKQIKALGYKQATIVKGKISVQY